MTGQKKAASMLANRLTVGRLLLYSPHNNERKQYHTAIVCYVHEDGRVNVAVNNAQAQGYALTHISVFEGEESACPKGQCCHPAFLQKSKSSKGE